MTIWLIQDSIFIQIKNSHNALSVEALKDFFDLQFRDKKFRFDLRKISDVYVFIGLFSFQNYCKDGEKEWKDILSKEQHEKIEKNKQLILGCMSVSKSKIDENIHYIEWIETFVKGFNIASQMINKYLSRTGCRFLIPREFIEDSLEYWFQKQEWNLFLSDDNEHYESKLDQKYDYYKIRSEVDWSLMFEKYDETKLKNHSNKITDNENDGDETDGDETDRDENDTIIPPNLNNNCHA